MCGFAEKVGNKYAIYKEWNESISSVNKSGETFCRAQAEADDEEEEARVFA